VVTVPPPTPGLPATYTIQKGEFPFCIARRFNLNVNELLTLNGLSMNSRVRTGITLKIPQTGNPFSGVRALRPHPATYTVKAGDTIYTVACYYGSASPDAIAQANNLTSPYALTPGQTLQIP
jgi:LysM repeat protein